MTIHKKGLLAALVLLLFVLIVPAGKPALAAGAGDYADYYLREITKNYPKRVFGSENNKAAANFIVAELSTMGYEVTEQPFTNTEKGIKGRNIEVLYPGVSTHELLICAHYDSVDTEGCDDNASGTATLLEIARVLQEGDYKPLCSVRMVFFDDEEDGEIGSLAYCKEKDQTPVFYENLLAVINIDSIAGGDNLYIHGGTAAGERVWMRNFCLDLANEMGLNMTTHPEVNYIPAGTREGGSDQKYFSERGIAYVYYEANIYSDTLTQTNYAVHYQTANPAIPGGQIMHSASDSLKVLNEVFPGRAVSHMYAYSKLTLNILYHLDGTGNYQKDGAVLKDKTEKPETTEAETEEETEEETETEAETEEVTEAATEAATEEETEIVIESVDEPITADAETADAFLEQVNQALAAQEADRKANRLLILAGAIVALIFGGLVGFAFHRRKLALEAAGAAEAVDEEALEEAEDAPEEIDEIPDEAEASEAPKED